MWFRQAAVKVATTREAGDDVVNAYHAVPESEFAAAYQALMKLPHGTDDTQFGVMSRAYYLIGKALKVRKLTSAADEQSIDVAVDFHDYFKAIFGTAVATLPKDACSDRDRMGMRV
jgi:hypothetical protein